MDWIKKNAAQFSGYLESRNFNRKLYTRLLTKLQEIEDRHKEEFPGLLLEISMSAKYQTPYVKIENEAGDYSKIGGVESEVMDAIDEVGFSVGDVDEKDYGYIINFND